MMPQKSDHYSAEIVADMPSLKQLIEIHYLENKIGEDMLT
jgi:hypothetical protein